MFRLIKLIIWIGVIAGIIFYVNYQTFTQERLTKDVIITVQKGDNLTKVITRELGWDETYLKIYLHLHPEKKIQIQQGEFRLKQGDDISGIIDTLKNGAKTIEEKLTLLEGWNIYDIDGYLAKKGLIQSGEFILKSKNIDTYKENFSFLQEASSLEGYLYPDTYFVNPTTFSIEDFHHTLLENFRKKIYDHLLTSFDKKTLDIIINLASIVEKEERNPKEKPIVAGILKKRYQEGWMIGADATACYAFELTSEQCKMNLSKYIAEKNEYNTRTKVGLPKTPIGNPSFESVSAVINSQNTPYYYYLHDITTGEIYYAQTNEEHIQNKRKYIK